MLLTTNHLTIGYGTKAVQNDINVSVNSGALIALVGTNGAGKSTLLRTISALQPPLSGNIYINDTDIRNLTSQSKAKLLSVVLTDKIEIDNLTVRQLVSMGRFPYTNWLGSMTDADCEIVDKAIADVNLRHKASSYINQISDGEKQRAVIARALAQDTPLIILDEPTAHLDLPNRIETMLLLRRLSVTTKKTFILSTHELEIALQTADQIWLMTKGQIQTGIPEDLMLNDSFQNAFASANYSFDATDGHCIIHNLRGNAAVNITYSDGGYKRNVWLRRALMRTGISVSQQASTTIHCNEMGYQIIQNGSPATDTFTSIQSLLETLNTLSL